MRNKHSKNSTAGKNFLMYFFLLSLWSFSNLFSQTATINGRLRASNRPVQDALVAFIYKADTTKKFTATTNDLGRFTIEVPTAITGNGNSFPLNFELAQNYPNPFSSETTIPYYIQKPSDIQVNIYDILGRMVRNFNVGIKSAGVYSILWDGRNNLGERVASGIYFYRLKVGQEVKVKKMVFNLDGGNSKIQLPNMNVSNTNWKLNKASQAVHFQIKITNSATTLPIIVPKNIDNVAVENDTLIIINVDYMTTAVVDFDSVHQVIRGFGAANILSWRPDMTDSEITNAFGTDDGQLGFSILRLRISPNSDDWGVNVATAKKAYDLGATIVAAPWSPPAFMKTNTNLIGGELDEGYYQDYAEHLDAFVDFMADNNIDVYAVSLQNEPDANVDYESCDWNSSQMRKFLRENAPLNNTKLMVPESQNFVRSFSDAILNDSTANAHFDIVAGHIYGGGLSPYPLAGEKGKEVWMTEHLNGENYQDGINDSEANWDWSFATAIEMSRVMDSGMSAYIWWFIVRFYGPISDGTNNSGTKGDITKKGYVMSQFARFIRPGDYRIEGSVYPYTGNILFTAYKDSLSSKVVLVAINTDSEPVDVTLLLRNGTLDYLTPYTTTESKDVEQGDDIIISDNKPVITLEASSITTLIQD